MRHLGTDATEGQTAGRNEKPYAVPNRCRQAKSKVNSDTTPIVSSINVARERERISLISVSMVTSITCCFFVLTPRRFCKELFKNIWEHKRNLRRRVDQPT